MCYVSFMAPYSSLRALRGGQALQALPASQALQALWAWFLLRRSLCKPWPLMGFTGFTVRLYGSQALTPYGPGSFAEEAYVSFMASYKPYERS